MQDANLRCRIGLLLLIVVCPAALGQPPDLRPVTATVNGTSNGVAFPMQELQVDYTIWNAGGAITLGSWGDRVLLSSNTTVDASAVLLATRTEQAPCSANQTYARRVAVIVPLVRPGQYYLIVRADGGITGPVTSGGNIAESNENNNNMFIQVLIGGPNLQSTEAHVNGLAVGGKTAEFVYTVQNSGNGPVRTGTYFHDFVYLSSNTTWDAADSYLFSMGTSAGLDAGQHYTRTNTVALPLVMPGTYYLIVRADKDDTIGEWVENDNDTAFRLSSDISLAIRTAQPNVELFWPVTIDEYSLASSSNLMGETWQPVLNTVVIADSTNKVSVPVIMNTTLFRLQR